MRGRVKVVRLDLSDHLKIITVNVTDSESCLNEKILLIRMNLRFHRQNNFYESHLTFLQQQILSFDKISLRTSKLEQIHIYINEYVLKNERLKFICLFKPRTIVRGKARPTSGLALESENERRIFRSSLQN